MSQQGRDSSQNQKGNILVIDDSVVIRNMLTEVLEDNGFAVTTAEDGEKGCELALREFFDVIICDVHMPRMNGLETVREIVNAKPESRVIMTDSMPDKMAQQARNEGALTCLQKPFDVVELRSLINSVISKGATDVDRK